MPSYIILMFLVAVTELLLALIGISFCCLFYFALGRSGCLEGLLTWLALVFSKDSTLCCNSRDQLFRLGIRPIAVLESLSPKTVVKADFCIASRKWFHAVLRG